VIVGHYAASLIPRSVLGDRCPYWLLLLCAQVPEFLWLALSLAGVERPHPDSMLDATFPGLSVEMIYSHNLVPALAQAALVGAIVLAVTRRRDVAAWCAGLVVVHVLCDYLVGFDHQVLGPTSPSVALDSYGRFPHAAILFELVFSLALVLAYHAMEARRGRPVPRGRRMALLATFAIGVLAWLPAADRPLRALVSP
jgi:membrane-bound metal-dependent hydrolase YbcI (DUF457 family)